jgi:type II secretory ATPase GspE/PulE/Tfp pilus assembly ATPase PilB-like protein
MVSPGDPSEPAASPPEKPDAGKPKPDWMAQIDAELAFRLIDSILPFEACLYHQVMPLSLEGSRLKLGMVNTDDTAALDYVRKILAYMNCSLVPHPLASDVHYAALSAYLSYADAQKNAVSTPQPVARRIAKKLAEQSVKRVAESRGVEAEQSGDRTPPVDPYAHPTLLVDSPTELPPPLTGQLGLTPGINGGAESQPAAALNEPVLPFAANPPELYIDAQYSAEPTDVLAQLPPDALLQELLRRILSWGIGRLHLERNSQYGQILWSQNGKVQAVLEDIPAELFQGVVNELKGLMQLPRIPAHKVKQVEIERLYQRQRVLLRMRLMPGQHGEEATLQALRGAALKFYRQQQLVNLGQEALSTAQQLQARMNDLYLHSRSYAVALPAHLNIAPELSRTFQRLHHQLNELQSLRFDDTTDEE